MIVWHARYHGNGQDLYVLAYTISTIGRYFVTGKIDGVGIVRDLYTNPPSIDCVGPLAIEMQLLLHKGHFELIWLICWLLNIVVLFWFNAWNQRWESQDLCQLQFDCGAPLSNGCHWIGKHHLIYHFGTLYLLKQHFVYSYWTFYTATAMFWR